MHCQMLSSAAACTALGAADVMQAAHGLMQLWVCADLKSIKAAAGGSQCSAPATWSMAAPMGSATHAECCIQVAGLQDAGTRLMWKYTSLSFNQALVAPALTLFKTQ